MRLHIISGLIACTLALPAIGAETFPALKLLTAPSGEDDRVEIRFSNLESSPVYCKRLIVDIAYRVEDQLYSSFLQFSEERFPAGSLSPVHDRTQEAHDWVRMTVGDKEFSVESTSFDKDQSQCSLVVPPVHVDPPTIFTVADNLFAKRDAVAGDDTNIRDAKAEYRRIIASGVKQEELVRAVTGLMRASYYHGRYLMDASTSEARNNRRKFYRQCREGDLAAIAEQSLGYRSSYYHYFKLLFLDLELQDSNYFEALQLATAVLQAQWDALEGSQEDIEVEGGGIHRVIASVNLNEHLHGTGAARPSEALVHIDKAIASSGMTSGDFMCENYLIKVKTLAALNRYPEAKTLAAETVSTFQSYMSEAGIIEEIFRAETLKCIDQVRDLRDRY